jgi:hypothetical protein
MKKHALWIVGAIVLVVCVIVPLVLLLVMSLWNWLMPSIFGLRAVTFWEAGGLLLLSSILFGGHRGARVKHNDRRRSLLDRWDRMTPEERAEFRALLRDHAADSEPP